MTVRGALAGRRILVTGASGFLGKVWLAHLLREVRGLERVWVLLRPGASADAHERLADLLATSPAFEPLEDGDLGSVGALDGDITRPLCGLSPSLVDALRLDLIVHLAGLTTLEPDLDDALAANVDGALHALELARRTGARLIHVSTAYVAGRRSGQVEETLEPDAVPTTGAEFSARRELSDLRALAQRVRGEAHDQQRSDALRRRAREQQRRLGGDVADCMQRERDAWIRERLAEETAARARRWGWPNLYAQTKSLAESLLLEERGDVPLWIVRPTVVESAQAFPFPGWKEGLQTSAPLTYAMTHGPLRGLPARTKLVLDVIPVDFVARSLSVLSAALLEAGSELRVFHLGSSADNPFPMGRVIDLTNMAHRKHEGLGEGALTWRSLVPDAAATSVAGYERTSVPLLRRLTEGAGELLDAAAQALPEGELAAKARKLARQAGRTGRRLETLEDVVERFLPFVLTNDCVFASGGIRALERTLDADEREAFAADPADLDWRRYWIDVHVPGLRRWVYPRIEGKRLPAPTPRHITLERAPLPEGVQVQ